MFISGITGVVGMSFSTELASFKAVLIFVATFLSYGFGQALTDCFQIDTDSLSSPYRPLTQGIVSRKYFLIISVIGLCSVIFILTIFNPVNLLLGILAGFGLSTYTYFKRKWWAGPFYNSWIVLVLFIMSYFAALGKAVLHFTDTIFITAAIAVFFCYANFVLTGYFKDIEADRSTSYKTLPVVFGRRISVFVSDAFAFIYSITIFILIVSLAFDSFPYETILKSIVFIYCGIGATVVAQLNLHAVKSDVEARKAVVPCVHGYILLLAGIAILNKPEWFLLIMIFYLLFIITMITRPVKEQI
jgi:4-hydroxybenzoate polyprenyltransferase